MGLLGIGAKLAGKALRWATKGRLIGSGGGRAIARRAAGAAATAIGVGVGAYVPTAIGNTITRMRGFGYGRTSPGGQERTMPVGTPAQRRAWEREIYPEGVPSYGRRYRRINPMNVRALRRSVRRINSAEKLFRQVFTITKGQVNVRKARRSR